MIKADDFQEIGNCGGKITFRVVTSPDGHRGFQVSFVSTRPVPFVMISVYATTNGIPVARLPMGGIGEGWPPPPFPGCVPVMIGSDSHGRFGHTCPRCNGYWRSGPWPNVCPYCATQAETYEFLSEAQLRYVSHYCKVLGDAIASAEDGDTTIDMDAVADAVDSTSEKPAFYVSEQAQQSKFTCTACDEFNDILGRFGYCSLCGTRNDLAEFEGMTIPAIRARLNGGTPPEDCLRDGVAAFDSFVAQYARQLAEIVPMTESRRIRLTKQRFQEPGELCSTFRDWFDIDIRAGIDNAEWRQLTRMFCRRHVYEHNGGEVDQRYLDTSGDTSVKIKQRISETQGGTHELVNSLVKMARVIHTTFHEIIEPLPAPIKSFEDRKARIAKYSKENG